MKVELPFKERYLTFCAVANHFHYNTSFRDQTTMMMSYHHYVNGFTNIDLLAFFEKAERIKAKEIFSIYGISEDAMDYLARFADCRASKRFIFFEMFSPRWKQEEVEGSFNIDLKGFIIQQPYLDELKVLEAWKLL